MKSNFFFIFAVTVLYCQSTEVKALAGTQLVGAVTNGLSAEIRLVDWSHSGAGIDVNRQNGFDLLVGVYVRRQAELPMNVLAVSSPGSTQPIYYWGATNSFCGPMELTDLSGKKMRLLKPDVNSSAAYPDCFNLFQLRQNWWKKNQNHAAVWMLPAPGEKLTGFLRENGRFYQLSSFYLGDYFKLRGAGEYKLTIWPKVYERSATNDEYFDRVDLPAMTIPIHWK